MIHSQSDARHCVIVGGGVIGLSIAWELSRRGLRCTVIDARGIGTATSWAGAGILPPARFDTARDPLDRLRGLSHEIHPEWAERLASETGIDTGYRRCGGLYVARTAGEAASLAALAAYWSEYGIDARPLQAEDLLHRPALAPLAHRDDLRGLWWVPDECQLRPPRHLRALQQACVQQGVTLVEHAEVRRLDIQGDSVRAVHAGESGSMRWPADEVVLCGGAWASRFADPRGAVGNVYPVRGQVVMYAAPAGAFVPVVNEGHRYLVPRDDGHVYVGSNEEEVGWVQETTDEVIGSLRQWAQEIVPMLADAPIVGTWSGLRPGSFDGFPYIGRTPGLKNLYLATGHYRSGLHLSCGTAVVLADLMTGQPALMDLDPFRPGR